MRALLVIVLLCAVASGAPPYKHTASPSTDPAVLAAERKWTIAEASRGPAASDLWEDAAVAFVAIVDAGTLPRSELVLASKSALAAFKNAMALDPRVKRPASDDYDRVPLAQTVSARDKKMIHLLEVASSFETDPNEIAGLDFLRANVWRRYNQFDEAIPIFQDLIANHPRLEVAEYAANLLLDIYNRLQRYDALIALAKKLRADKAFLANRPDLAAVVKKIFTTSQGMVARIAAQRARETGERHYFEQCAEAYLAVLDPADFDKSDDEILYNAMVCYEEAGSVDRALAILRRMSTEFPSSPLAKRATVRSIHMLAQTGRFDEASLVADTWLRTNALERDAADVLDDTIRWHMATGSLDGAVRVLDDYATRVRRLPALLERRTASAITLARALLAANRRADAIRVLRPPPALARTTDTASRLDLASAFAAAACPVMLVDGLCPRAREDALLATARRELSRVQNPNDAATLLLTNLALEAILNKHAPTANLAADYQHLTTSADAEIRVEAHLRLATLAKYARDTVEQTKQLELCIAESQASHAGDTWRAICDRELGLHHELLPDPARGPVPLALEAPVLPPAKPSPITNRIEFD